jgi:hypothetical protein
MLEVLMTFHRQTMAAIMQGFALEKITGLAVVDEIAQMKQLPPAEAVPQLEALLVQVRAAFRELGVT